MKLSPTSIIFFILFPYYVMSQTGPGGVGNVSNNGLWLRADSFTTAGANSLWQDTSGNSNDAVQATAINQPQNFVTSSLNNMPIVRFDGTNDEMSVADSPILDGTAGITYFAVVRPNNLNGAPRGILGKRFSFSTNTNYSYTWFMWSNNFLNLDIVTGNNRLNTGPVAFSNATNYILSFTFDGSLTASQRSKIYSEMNLITTSTENSTSIPNGSAPLAIGALNVGYGTYFGGDYAEIIHYNYTVTEVERIIVNNYLSAKYNVPLTSNDFYDEDTSGGNYDFNVAGIGQAADASSHTDSQGTGIVRINTPSSLSNGDYLFWGENVKDPTYAFVANTINYSEQLNSQWRVSKIADLGNVSVSFDISTLDLTAKQACAPLELVIDNNSDFSSPTAVYDLTISGTLASANSVVFNDGDYFTLRYKDQIVWDGTSYFNGSGPANAPDNTDSCLKLTIKAGANGVLINTAHVREIEVETGATLQVNDGILLEVENGILNNGEIDLLGEAQLIQNHTGISLNTGTGELKIRQEGTTNLYNYNFWSAPVNRSGNWQVSYLETSTGPVGFTTAYDADPSASPIELSTYWLYTFNNLLNNYYGWQQITTTTGVLPGFGYTMKGSGSGALSESYVFNGTANDGDINIPALAGNQILIGNPYPSAINTTQFINDNLPVIDGSLYFYEHFNTNNTHVLADYQGGYATYNLLLSLASPAPAANGGVPSKGAPTNSVAVGQGFFVNIQNNGSIIFDNSQREFRRESLAETTFYRSAQVSNTDDRIKFWLKLKDSQNNSSTIALGYDQNASTGFDIGYDSEILNILSNQIYWIIPEKQLSIQGLNSFNINEEIPLGIDITNTGTYTFEISETLNFPTNETIYLKDNLTYTYYDIKTNPITLNLSDTINQTRFSIVYQTSSVLSTLDFETNPLNVYYNIDEDALVLDGIENLNTIKSLKIYNILGQIIKTNTSIISKKTPLALLKAGVYILEVNLKSGVKTTLKFVKQ